MIVQQHAQVCVSHSVLQLVRGARDVLVAQDAVVVVVALDAAQHVQVVALDLVMDLARDHALAAKVTVLGLA